MQNNESGTKLCTCVIKPVVCLLDVLYEEHKTVLVLMWGSGPVELAEPFEKLLSSVRFNLDEARQSVGLEPRAFVVYLVESEE